MNSYSILVNTCDKFEDCWDPFFKLFSIYWPNYQGKIYLNTEYKDYAYPGLDIVAVKGCARNNFPKDKRATWSQCLKWALDIMDNDIVLYMQEDYFFKNKVDGKWVDYFYKLMKEHSDIPCIQLTPESIPPTVASCYDKLYKSDPNFYSYVSCQASLWRKKILHSIIREHETAWNFEWWGSKRAKYFGYEFLVVAPNWVKRDGYQIIPYLFTGVIGGKWYKPVVDLFKKHDIAMDYNIRGFFERQTPSLKKRWNTKLGIWKSKSILENLKLSFKSIIS